jgi:hypothetical protein
MHLLPRFNRVYTVVSHFTRVCLVNCKEDELLLWQRMEWVGRRMWGAEGGANSKETKRQAATPQRVSRHRETPALVGITRDIIEVRKTADARGTTAGRSPETTVTKRRCNRGHVCVASRGGVLTLVRGRGAERAAGAGRWGRTPGPAGCRTTSSAAAAGEAATQSTTGSHRRERSRRDASPASG